MQSVLYETDKPEHEAEMSSPAFSLAARVDRDLLDAYSQAVTGAAH